MIAISVLFYVVAAFCCGLWVALHHKDTLFSMICMLAEKYQLSFPQL